MNKEEISQKLKDSIFYTFKHPFDTGVVVSLYIIGAAAGICCVIAAIGLAISMINPLLQGVVQ